jgi:transposase
MATVPKQPKPLTVGQFFEQFPDDDACLEHLFQVRYGDNPQCQRCGEEGRFHKLAKLPAYTCNCGNHIHPMVGTPFHRSRTPLQKWFYAMYLFTTTRNGVSAKEIQRQLGVTYKCAWRMAGLIRSYMGWVDGDAPIGGPGAPIVEADEVQIGGVDRKGHDDKTLVLGMVERGGEIVTRVVPDRREYTFAKVMDLYVRKGSRVATDTANAFRNLRAFGYYHAAVNHTVHEYFRGPVHTNTIDGFWSWFQRAVASTHVWVSPKYLQRYLGEFEFRFNLRKQPHLLLASFQRS